MKIFFKDELRRYVAIRFMTKKYLVITVNCAVALIAMLMLILFAGADVAFVIAAAGVIVIPAAVLSAWVIEGKILRKAIGGKAPFSMQKRQGEIGCIVGMATSTAAMAVPIGLFGFGELCIPCEAFWYFDEHWPGNGWAVLAVDVLGWILLFTILNVLAALGGTLACWMTTKVIRCVTKCVVERT